MRKFTLLLYMILGILPFKISILPICVFLIPFTANILKDVRIDQMKSYFGYLFVLICIPTALYPFHLFNSDYDPSYRDLAYLFSPVIIIAFAIPFLAIKDEKQLDFIKNSYIFVSVVVCSLGIFQFFNFTAVTTLLSYVETLSETQENYFKYNLRARSVFPGNPNLFGLFSTTAIYVTLYYGTRSVIFIPALILFLIALLVSGSITAIVLTIIIVARFYGKVSIFLIPVLGFIVVFTMSDFIQATTERQKLSSSSLIPSSLLARIYGPWSEAFANFLESPILGIGPAVSKMSFSADSFYLEFLMKSGVFGAAVLFLSLIYYCFFKKYSRYFGYMLLYGIVASLFRNDQQNFLMVLVIIMDLKYRTITDRYA